MQVRVLFSLPNYPPESTALSAWYCGTLVPARKWRLEESTRQTPTYVHPPELPGRIDEGVSSETRTFAGVFVRGVLGRRQIRFFASCAIRPSVDRASQSVGCRLRPTFGPGFAHAQLCWLEGDC